MIKVDKGCVSPPLFRRWTTTARMPRKKWRFMGIPYTLWWTKRTFAIGRKRRSKTIPPTCFQRFEIHSQGAGIISNHGQKWIFNMDTYKWWLKKGLSFSIYGYFRYFCLMQNFRGATPKSLPGMYLAHQVLGITSQPLKQLLGIPYAAFAKKINVLKDL